MKYGDDPLFGVDPLFEHSNKASWVFLGLELLTLFLAQLIVLIRSDSGSEATSSYCSSYCSEAIVISIDINISENVIRKFGNF